MDHDLLSESLQSKHLVLCIDNDADTRSLIDDALANAGFEVIQAANCAEAVTSVSARTPDIILLSAYLAAGACLDVIAQVRALPSVEHIPVLIITSAVDVKTIVEGYHLGATAFLTQPINYEILPYRLKYLLRSNSVVEIASSSGAFKSDEQQQIHNLAYYDVVTGLPNRAQLNEQLMRRIKLAERHGEKFALLFLDLDHFKQVNDTLGHDAGDDLLKAVSTRLADATRDCDIVIPGEQLYEDDESVHTVARLGGDEFVILLGRINRAEDAARVAERISKSISEPYQITDTTVSVTTTIGISVYPTDGCDSEAMMKSADVAMYHAKEAGRNGYQFYSRDIQERALARLSMEIKLTEAIENEDMTIVYQPKICFSSGRVTSVEALVRWVHAEDGPISPAEFIPLAEETGLILPLGRWVLRAAAQQLQDWITAGMNPLIVSVNCSSVQFERSDIAEDIRDAIDRCGLESKFLEIEITEKTVIKDVDEGVEILRSLKQLGVQVAIDDFGTGFSSLSYLKRLPVDKLKIDNSFIKNLTTDRGDAAIVNAIITLSRNLELQVAAEGVETSEQFELLKEMSCDEGQGYLFGKPMAANAFSQWLIAYEPTNCVKAPEQRP